MNVVLDNQLFPCIDCVKLLKQHKYIKFYTSDCFKKKSFSNRYVIAGANGITSLTIPVAGGREQKTRISNIQIDCTVAWQSRHWKTILSAYRKAPFFEYYEEEIKQLIFNSEKSLFNFNLAILNKVCKWLSINVVISLFDEDQINEKEIDYRNIFLPKSFQNSEKGWQPRYAQVFEERIGFQPNLSILDLLFCEGPNSVGLLDPVIKNPG